MVKGSELQLLVCTGNLGNACPDDESIAEWIPADGQCIDCLKYPPKYPLVMGNNHRTYPNTFEAYDEDDKFDLIVIGMQEATFDPPSNDDDAMDTTTSIHSVILNPMVHQPATAVKKTITNLTSYVASRDHTVAPKRTSAFRTVTASTVASGGGATEAGSEVVVVDWDMGTSLLHDMLQRRLPSYSRQVSYQRGQMRLEVFARNDINSGINVTVLHTKAQNTGRAGLANKGGIVTELLINGKTRIAFLTAHLEAHEGVSKYQIRCQSLADILAGTKYGIHDVSLTSHFNFVLGDLNFRSDLGLENISDDEHKQRVKKLVIDQNWEALNHCDELHKALRRKDCLVGFNTLSCNFPPTFKMERCKGYTYADKRRPSYTDRVLYKTGPELEQSLTPLLYEPIDNFATSDHKPVRAAFSLKLNEPIQLRAKMARRRSAMQMANDILHVSSDLVVAHRERLHIFLNDMSCQLNSAVNNTAPLPSTTTTILNTVGATTIMNGVNLTTSTLLSTVGANASTLPSPYLCIVSSPEEILQKRAGRLLWQRWTKNLLPNGISMANLSVGSKKKSASSQQSMDSQASMKPQTTHQGWPQTSVQKNTLSPDWGGEELHTEIKTYWDDGSPLDMTGAMLRFTVVDSNDGSVLGTCTYNLGNLVKTFRPPGESRVAQLEQQQQLPVQQSKRGNFQRRGSLLGIFNRSGNQSSMLQQPSSTNVLAPNPYNNSALQGPAVDVDPIKSITIDQALVRNGQETGRVRFTLDAWWMTEATAKALLPDKVSKHKPKKVSIISLNRKKRQSEAVAAAAALDLSDQLDAPPSHVFSQRRTASFRRSAAGTKNEPVRRVTGKGNTQE